MGIYRLRESLVCVELPVSRPVAVGPRERAVVSYLDVGSWLVGWTAADPASGNVNERCEFVVRDRESFNRLFEVAPAPGSVGAGAAKGASVGSPPAGGVRGVR